MIKQMCSLSLFVVNGSSLFGCMAAYYGHDYNCNVINIIMTLIFLILRNSFTRPAIDYKTKKKEAT